MLSAMLHAVVVRTQRFHARQFPPLLRLFFASMPGTSEKHRRRRRERHHSSKSSKYPRAEYFTTLPEAGRTSVASEVKLYLALRLPVPLLIGRQPARHRSRRRTRSGSAAGPPQGTILVHERARQLDEERPQVNRRADQLAVSREVRVYATLTNHRGSRSAPLATALMRPARSDG